MNLELILWIASGIVIMEGLFIYILKNESISNSLLILDWVGAKIFAIFFTGIFMLIQYGIVFGEENGFGQIAHYIRLQYEFLIILGIVILFLINRFIAKKIDNDY